MEVTQVIVQNKIFEECTQNECPVCLASYPTATSSASPSFFAYNRNCLCLRASPCSAVTLKSLPHPLLPSRADYPATGGRAQLPRQHPHPSAEPQGLCQKLQAPQHPPLCISGEVTRTVLVLATGLWQASPA